MAMIDSSVLAQLCALEGDGVTAPILITDLWRWTWDTVENSPQATDVVSVWASNPYDETPDQYRANYRLRSAVNSLMTKGLIEGIYVLRVQNERSTWRVPPEAFKGWMDGMDLEMTWAVGRLWDWDASENYAGLARLELPLRTTETEAAAYRSFVAREIAAVENPRPGSSIRDSIKASMAQHELGQRQDWALHEALLWIALRDPIQVGAYLVANGERYRGERGDMVEATISFLFHPDDGVESKVVERFPASALTRALRAELLASTGRVEGQRREVPATFYVDGRPGAVDEFRVRQSDVLRVWPSDEMRQTADELAAAALGQAAWADELMTRKLWSSVEVVAWVGLRDAALMAEGFGPGAPYGGALGTPSRERIHTVLAIVEAWPEAHVRIVGPELQHAVQRRGLLAANCAPGDHARHKVEDLVWFDFYRDDVLAMFPALPAPTPAAKTSEVAPEALDEAAIRRLIIATSPPGKVISQAEAEKLVKSKDHLADREVIRSIVTELSGGRGRGRPSKTAA